jgi:hypothetical protein
MDRLEESNSHNLLPELCFKNTSLHNAHDISLAGINTIKKRLNVKDSKI